MLFANILESWAILLNSKRRVVRARRQESGLPTVENGFLNVFNIWRRNWARRRRMFGRRWTDLRKPIFGTPIYIQLVEEKILLW